MAEYGSFSSGSNPSMGITPTLFNTENNLALPQGWQTPTSLPSSISSTITSLLYQASKKPSNYWSGFFSSNTPPTSNTTAFPTRTTTTPAPTSNVFDFDHGSSSGTNTLITQSSGSRTSGATSTTTNSNNFTTGGTIKLSDGKYYTVLGLASEVPSGTNGQKTYTTTGTDGKKYRITLGPNSGRTPVTAPTTNTPTSPTGGTTTPSTPPISLGNPIQAYTLQALQIADAYFSPKRIELAYELEQMDVDMRRLAVNLGRQIDDPILQAKLYKEAMKQTRQLDNDQSVFALQMVEQRRKEEIANRQFYDQLSLEIDKVKAASQQFFASLNLQRGQTELADKQFYASLALQNAIFEWQKQQVANIENPPPAVPPTNSPGV